MLFPPKPLKRVGVEVPLTSLVDVVFLLLIYFLLTFNFLTAEGIDVDLPRAQSPQTHIEKAVTVTLDHQGHLFLGEERVLAEDLSSRLRSLLSQRSTRVVVVRADRQVLLDRAVRILDLAKKAGATHLTLATQKDP